MKKTNNIIIICLSLIVILIIFIFVGISNGFFNFKRSDEDIQKSKLKSLSSKLDIMEVKTIPDNLPDDIKQIIEKDSDKTFDNLNDKTIQFVIDTSTNLNDDEKQALQTAIFNISNKMPTNCNVELITYNSNITVYNNLGTFTDKTKNNFATFINLMQNTGHSRMYDSLIYAMNKDIDVKNANIILISCGPVNYGYTYNDVKDKLEYTNIPIYTVSYNQTIETDVLKEISDKTDAKYYDANEKNIENKLCKILKSM